MLLTGGSKGMMFKRELRVEQTLRPCPHVPGYFYDCRFLPMRLGMILSHLEGAKTFVHIGVFFVLVFFISLQPLVVFNQII